MTEQEYNSITDQQGAQVVDNKGKILVACLDRSGSMGGRPMEAVKLGAKKIGETLLSNTVNCPFERFITLTYDTQLEQIEIPKLEDYNKKIDTVNARGGTSFTIVFNWLLDFVNKSPCKELTIIFFTDGEDTSGGQH